MTVRITIDRAGRVVIPKTLRDALYLRPGDSLELDSSGEEITLRPIRQRIPLHKKRGIWVYRTGHSIKTPIPDLIDQVREERSRDLI